MKRALLALAITLASISLALSQTLEAPTQPPIDGTLKQVVGVEANPTSTMTLTATTTAFGTNTYIAPANGVIPSFTLLQPYGMLSPRVRLSTNDTTATSWGSQTIQVDEWSCAPTFTNGDRGAWLPTTGAGTGGYGGGGCHLASYTCVMAGTTSAVYGDGTYSECAVTVGTTAVPKLYAGALIYWTLEAVSGSGITGASKTFTLVPETLQ